MRLLLPMLLARAASSLGACRGGAGRGFKLSAAAALAPAAAVAAPAGAAALTVDEFARGLPQSGLERFDAFCKHVLAGGNPSNRNETKLERGQVVSQYWFPGLRAQAWWRKAGAPAAAGAAEDVAWLERFEEQRDAVVEELRAAVQGSKPLVWREAAPTGNGFEVADLSDALAPRTMQALDVSGVNFRGARAVMLARLEPGARLHTHSDYYNYVLTAHLPLFSAPERVDRPVDLERDERLEAFRHLMLQPQHVYPAFEKRGKAGMVFKHVDSFGEVHLTHAAWFSHENAPQRALLLDTTFTHSAFNDNVDEYVYFLHVDVWHPDLSEKERIAIKFLDETFRKRQQN
ncbi:hypothetical protein M885DRAFT_522103 [Pelagophyceae sp. CCMP2097]|nr:hypothetical protein M885DRAFT_522103 [Pelagophyceae sp. CCMP2097]